MWGGGEAAPKPLAHTQRGHAADEPGPAPSRSGHGAQRRDGPRGFSRAAPLLPSWLEPEREKREKSGGVSPRRGAAATRPLLG